MKNNRRNFLKLIGLAGLSVAGGSFLKGLAAESGKLNKSNNRARFKWILAEHRILVRRLV